MPKIDEIYAYIAEDNGPEDEGVVAMSAKGWWLPMFGADRARIDSLRPMAVETARVTGKKIILCRFSNREELEEIS
jgi:dihydroorotase-like cyclic amidohydrolase